MGLYTEDQLEEYVHKLPEYMWSMFDTFIPTIVPRYALEECHLNDGDIVVLCCDGVSDYLDKNDRLRFVDEVCQGFGISITEFFDSPLFAEDNLEP